MVCVRYNVAAIHGVAVISMKMNAARWNCGYRTAKDANHIAIPIAVSPLSIQYEMMVFIFRASR